MPALSHRLVRARGGLTSGLVGVVSAVTGCGFELLNGVVHPFLMRRGEGLKLNADSLRAWS